MDVEPAARELATPMPAGRRRLTLLLVVLVGLALHLPALSLGLFADDHTIALALDGELEGSTIRPTNLYDFGVTPEPGTPAYEVGAWPWWSSPDWKLRFFRPLTSLSLAADHALGGDWVARAHRTNLALFALLLVVLVATYRAFGLPDGTALLATLLFAVDDATLVPVAWLANRNSLLEVLFTVLGVLAALRLHAGPGLAAATLGASVAACLSKESGIVAPLLAALALLWRTRAQRDPAFRTRARSLAFALVGLAAIFLTFLLAQGYGSRSAFYPTPWGDPAGYLARLGVMLSVGGLALFTPYTPDLVSLDPRQLVPAIAVALVLVPLVARFVWKHARTSSAAPVLAVWVVLSILPQAGTLPSGRLLFGSAVASSALLALCVTGTLSRSSTTARGARLAGALLLFSALPLGAVTLLAGGVGLARDAAAVNATVRETDVGALDLGAREAIVLQAPDAIYALSPLSAWRSLTDDRDVRFWVLQCGRRGLRWTRVDERTFDLETLSEPFLVQPFETVFLSERRPPPLGTSWRTALFEVTALRTTSAGELAKIRVELERPLDDERLRFLVWDGARMVAIAPPRTGETRELAEVERRSPFLP